MISRFSYAEPTCFDILILVVILRPWREGMAMEGMSRVESTLGNLGWFQSGYLKAWLFGLFRPQCLCIPVRLLSILYARARLVRGKAVCISLFLSFLPHSLSK